MEPREEILDACAELFVKRGFAGTSTREIAEAVGIRQASIYHYFHGGKNEILTDLLQRATRPTPEQIEKIMILGVETDAEPEVLLYLLIIRDVRALASAPRNTGKLARLPQAEHETTFSHHQSTQQELVTAYARLGTQVAAARSGAAMTVESDLLGDLLLDMVGAVMRIRARGGQISATVEAIIAAACLRACHLDQTTIDQAAIRAGELISVLE